MSTQEVAAPCYLVITPSRRWRRCTRPSPRARPTRTSSANRCYTPYIPLPPLTTPTPRHPSPPLATLSPMHHPLMHPPLGKP